MILSKQYLVVWLTSVLILGLILGLNINKNKVVDITNKYNKLEKKHRDVILRNDSLVLAIDSTISFIQKERKVLENYVVALKDKDNITLEKYEKAFNTMDSLTWASIDSLWTRLLSE